MPSKPLTPETATQIQANVLRLFRIHGPMDDYQLIERYRDHYDYGISESTPRTRRRELADQGLVKATGLKNISQTGRYLTIWSLA